MIIRFLGSFIFLYLLLACARQTSPNGGPKDIAAPKLVGSTPQNNQKNFKSKILTFDFTEPVKLKDPKEEIIITPQAGKEITYLAKQNRITLENKNGWKDSTTYSITFRDAVQDITESNPVENLKIAFSTGPIIDSLNLEGRIVDALTEKIPEKITVAIHQSDTFNIFKHAPVYFTKTDKNGKFIITNLKPGAYKLYAFDDKNKNLKVESKTESVGFYPGLISLPDNTDSITLIMLSMDARPIHLNNVRHTDKSSTLKFNKELIKYSITNTGINMVNSFGDDHSEIRIYHKFPAPDSIPLNVLATDSLEQRIDTLVYVKAGTSPGFAGPFKFDLHEHGINRENYTFNTYIAVNKPLLSINTDSIFLRVDSTHSISITTRNIEYDTANNKITITREIDRKILDTLTTPLLLYLGKSAFISMENDSSKNLLTLIQFPKAEDTATLLLDIQTTQPDYEIQLLSDTYKIIRTARNVKKVTFRNLPAADYKIRAYIDKNHNNKWDPGNINFDIPPEPTYFYKNANGKFQFPLRANWEVGPYTFTF